MNGITFGALHSYRDLSLILKAKQIGTPAPKIKKTCRISQDAETARAIFRSTS